MEKHLKELKSMGDFEEFRGEVQVAVNSTMPDVNKEMQALRHSRPPRMLRSKPMRQ